MLAAALILAAPKPFRVYMVGNSVTDAVNYQGLQKMAESRGYQWTWGRHMIPGAPLPWLWKSQDSGFSQDPFGRSRQALTDFAWDAVTLQPFDRHLRDDQGDADIPAALEMIDLAVKKNPKTKLFIYARWPRMTHRGKGYEFDKNAYDPNLDRSQIDLTRVDTYADRWNAKYTGNWDETNESRDYFETLRRELQAARPGLKDQIRLIPVGHVFAALDQKMKAGKVPGYTSIYQVYNDAIHMGRLGTYIVGATFFASLTGQSPVGLPATTHGPLPPVVVPVVQQTVAEVVRKTP